MTAVASPDGEYIAFLGSDCLIITCTSTREVRVSLNLQAACTSLCWDAFSSADCEYRLALVANSHVIAIGFTSKAQYQIAIPTSGIVSSVQWIPMYGGRGQLVPRLASTSRAPDIANVWCNSLNSGQINLPKSQFVPVESIRGWALLHTRGTKDRVAFFAHGRIIGSVELPSGLHSCISGAYDAPLVAVAYSSALYLVCPTRVIALVQNLTIAQMAWMSCGSLIAISADRKALKLSRSLNLSAVISPNCVRAHVLAEKQVFEITSKPFEFAQPHLLAAKSGDFCAIQCKAGNFVYVLDCFGESELFDYRDELLTLEWIGDELCFKFDSYGVVWSQLQGFQVISFFLNGCSFSATNDGYLVWTDNGDFERVTADQLQSGVEQRLEDLCDNDPVNGVENGILSLDEELSLVSSPVDRFCSPFRASALSPRRDDDISLSFINLKRLDVPSLSPSMFDEPHNDEDTFHYKRSV